MHWEAKVFGREPKEFAKRSAFLTRLSGFARVSEDALCTDDLVERLKPTKRLEMDTTVVSVASASARY
jgi:hypothetical protein